MPVGAVALPLLTYLAWMATDAVERWAMALLASSRFGGDLASHRAHA